MGIPYSPNCEKVQVILSKDTDAKEFCPTCYSAGNLVYKQVEIVVTGSRSPADIEGYYVQGILLMLVPKSKCWHISQVWCPRCGLMYKPSIHKFVYQTYDD